MLSNPPPLPERHVRTALATLGHSFEESSKGHEVRAQAIQLYLQGGSNVLILMTRTRTQSMDEALKMVATRQRP